MDEAQLRQNLCQFIFAAKSDYNPAETAATIEQLPDILQESGHTVQHPNNLMEKHGIYIEGDQQTHVFSLIGSLLSFLPLVV